MPHPLLDRDVIHETPEEYLGSVGTVFAQFGALTQDSGNLSYGVQIGEKRYFIKTPGRPEDSRPSNDHASRVALLRNAVRLSRECRQPILPKLYHVIESPLGPMLVYEWLEGELIGGPRETRDDPQSAFQRFRRLPVSTIQMCLDAIFELHEQLSRNGWVAVDFYDGCLIYDFMSGRLGIVDLDHYHPGPFHNEMGRLFGSTRFMAPEEFELGARIDGRTNVFTLGRTALVFLADGTLNANAFRGTSALYEVIAKACEPQRSRRYDSVAAFCDAWRAARAD